MKKFLSLALLSFSVVFFYSCDDKKEEDNFLPATSNNVAGIWELERWNGAPLEDGSYVYLELIRKDTKFVIYQNIDSFGARKVTGKFGTHEDDEGEWIISGYYDNLNGDWEHDYLVKELTATSMTWVAKDDSSDVSVYKRVSEIPAGIAF